MAGAAAVLGLVVSADARAGDRPDAAAIRWLGAPFTGKVVATVRQPGAKSQGRAVTGTATAHFVDAGGSRLRLVLVGNVRKPSDTGFNVEGVASEAGWRGQAAGWSLSIAKNGTIDGGGVEAQHRLRFAGKASTERINLRVETELLQPNASGLPTGSVIAFDYTLRRPAQQATGDASGAPGPTTKKKCKRTIWQTRNVTTPLGGMQMIRVPVCRD